MSNILTSALGYGRKGMAVFPVQGKIPLTERGCKEASADQATIKLWFEKQHPSANVGIATGEVSGIWVLDIDGEDGEASLRGLEARHGTLPQTVEVITGGGGRHLYFQWVPGAIVGNSVRKLGAGLDVRGNGGYVVAPPSVHASGKRYEWSADTGNEIIHAPKWLMDVVLLPPTSQRVPVSSAQWQSMVKSVPEGQRNDTMARIAGKLLRFAGPSPADLDPDFIAELCLAVNDARCKPPLPHDEVMRTLDSIARSEIQRRGGR